MGPARHPRSLALAVLAVGLAMAVGGCGSSGDTARTTGGASSSRAPAGAAARACTEVIAGATELRVTGIGCTAGRGVFASWTKSRACRPAAGASRVSCSVDSYRCLGAVAERGLTVSCARPGRSVFFIVKRG